ncbi:DUF4124 domain-containing protein [Desulfocicer niacini]
MRRLIFIVWLLFVVTSAAHADIYKWRDTNGILHFGDQPPVGSKFENLDKPLNEQPLPPKKENKITPQITKRIAPPKVTKEKQIQNQIDLLLGGLWMCSGERSYLCQYRGVTSFEYSDGKLIKETMYNDGSMSKNEILFTGPYYFKEKDNEHGEYYMFGRNKLLEVYGNNGLIYKMKQLRR